MNTMKPERPSRSNLTSQQWHDILEQIEYEWDLERGFYQGPERANKIRIQHHNDFGVLLLLSLICPAEVDILEKYDEECHDEYIAEMEEFKAALIARVVIAKEDKTC